MSSSSTKAFTEVEEGMQLKCLTSRNVFLIGKGVMSFERIFSKQKVGKDVSFSLTTDQKQVLKEVRF